MRAGVLSDDQIIVFLNENFINTWVPNSELGRTVSLREPIDKRREREGKTFDTTHALAQAIISSWKKGSPVDCLVISPRFELIGRLLLNDFLFLGGDRPERYLTFLQGSLAGKLPGLGEDAPEPQSTDSETPPGPGTVSIDGLNVVLTPQKSEQEILNIFRTPKSGYQDYTVIEIDTTAFKKGGVLTIDISVGNAEPKGSFDLYEGDTELPTQGTPNSALTSVWDVPPGKSGTITYRFDAGKVFKLGATGSWFSKEGSTNAFLAKISVEPSQKPEPRKGSSARQEGESAEDVMNAFVKAFKNLDSEGVLSMVTGSAKGAFESDFESMPEDVRSQISQMLSQMKILSSEYVGDEFHFRLRVPGGAPPEVSAKMRKVEGVWFIYEVE